MQVNIIDKRINSEHYLEYTIYNSWVDAGNALISFEVGQHGNDIDTVLMTFGKILDYCKHYHLDSEIIVRFLVKFLFPFHEYSVISKEFYN